MYWWFEKWSFWWFLVVFRVCRSQLMRKHYSDACSWSEMSLRSFWRQKRSNRMSKTHFRIEKPKKWLFIDGGVGGRILVVKISNLHIHFFFFWNPWKSQNPKNDQHTLYFHTLKFQPNPSTIWEVRAIFRFFSGQKPIFFILKRLYL